MDEYDDDLREFSKKYPNNPEFAEIWMEARGHRYPRDFFWKVLEVERSCKNCRYDPRKCYACGGFSPDPSLYPDGIVSVTKFPGPVFAYKVLLAKEGKP
jgi:hypothetical protein